jgi:hypothetical protein
MRVITAENAALSTRRLVPGQCQSCGKQFFYQRTGRPKLFCDQKCRQSDFRRSGHIASKIDESAPKTPVNSGTFRPDFADRPPHVVAGPALSPSALRAASVGAASVIEANNRDNANFFREHNAKAAYLIKRHSAPVNVVGGHKFLGAPAVDAETMRAVFETEIIAGLDWEKVISADGVTCYRARLSDAPPPPPPCRQNSPNG